MYYIHLKIEEGFFPNPYDIEDGIQFLTDTEAYISVYPRGIIVVYKNKDDKSFIETALTRILFIAERVTKRSEPYKYKVKSTKRKYLL